MMDFTYENQGNSTFLVYEIGKEDELDTMSMGMLTNNHIPGFAVALFTQMDTRKYIKFNVSSKVSVAQLFSGPVNKKRLIGVLSGVVDAMLHAEDYMLDTHNILLDLNYIFVDVSSYETAVVCLPVMNMEYRNPEVEVFFKNIIFNTQYDQTENCDHVAQILNFLNSSSGLSLPEFKELLSKIGGSVADQHVRTVQQQIEKDEPVKAAIENCSAIRETPVITDKPYVASVADTDHENVQGYLKGMPCHKAAEQTKNDKEHSLNVSRTETEKPMTMFYLLQHYNKDNAATYKAQKEAKKAKKNEAVAVKQSAPQKNVAAKSTDTKYAVPGKAGAVSAGFAVPGQAPMPVVQHQVHIKEEVKTVQPSTVQPIAPVYQQPVQQVSPINFGETTMLDEEADGTTVLGAIKEVNEVKPYLIRIKNNERISIDKLVFRIGKERSYVDYIISDNAAISRGHANIVNHNGEFFVTDTNSTNHTYVNGSMIPSNVETKLSHGTKLRFANEEFEFKLY